MLSLAQKCDIIRHYIVEGSPSNYFSQHPGFKEANNGTVVHQQLGVGWGKEIVPENERKTLSKL